ncbi:OmpA family protein [Cytophagales bacterium LB-30]|uniref:OmpA family protein n=1 Tax=Shiella aurantiaca TaxID=3058365 RepID=A0ABT8F171_9BACT|nr:OmpA family protein [Shiella aurantiaca]MDN4164185.1 OmpA family protein [Shiella aurantiaca]
MRFFLFAIPLLCLQSVHAQQRIQWASKVDFQFNEYSDSLFSARSVLGEPDAFPYGTLNPKAFRLLEESAFGTLDLRFDTAQQVQQIIIIESYLPGRISEVTLIDEDLNKYPIYLKNPEASKDSARALVMTIDPTNYKVKGIEINLNSIVQAGWAQLDAVGIRNSDNEEELLTMLAQYDSIKVYSEMTFATAKLNLGTNINTEYVETKPVISPDGKLLFFVRQNFPGNVGGERDVQDIYFSEQVDGKWTEAKNIGEPLNNRYPNGVSSVTPEGHLLLINTYEDNGTMKPGASISYRTGDGWTAPVNLKIDDFYNRSPYMDVCMSSSGKSLIMAVKRRDSSGDQDLYISFLKEDSTWSAPVNMGDRVNTPKAEFSPFLAADDKTLFFASEGHSGYGGSDIFYTKRLDNTWTNWSPPVNLGNSVNTKNWDAYYSMTASGDFAFFVSTENSFNGTKDIYNIGLPQEFKPEPVLLVAGKVLDKTNNQPIKARIRVKSLPDGGELGIASSNEQNGEYQIVLPRGVNYAVYAQAKGYIAVEENLNVMKITKYEELEKNLYLVPIRVGETIVLNNVYFEQGKANLLPESYPELEELARLMSENSTLSIELGGHTDNQGSANANFELSQTRVETVKSFLVSKDIEAGRINTKAYGGTRPIAPNTSEETRSRNRRVDFTVISFE